MSVGSEIPTVFKDVFDFDFGCPLLPGEGPEDHVHSKIETVWHCVGADPVGRGG